MVAEEPCNVHPDDDRERCHTWPVPKFPQMLEQGLAPYQAGGGLSHSGQRMGRPLIVKARQLRAFEFGPQAGVLVQRSGVGAGRILD